MIFRASKLKGAELVAKDGVLGEVKEFLFTDDEFKVRYLVVDTGGFLAQHPVLISPHSVTGIDPRGVVGVRLTREQVKNSPAIDTAAPVSRTQESALNQYYGWPQYWGGLGIAGMGAAPVLMPRATMSVDLAGADPMAAFADPKAGDIENIRGDVDAGERQDNHLHSSSDIRGYKIQAVDGETFGSVDDILIDDGEWSLDYFVVDTVSWVPSDSVILQPSWVVGLDRSARVVKLNVTKDVVFGAPVFDADNLPHHPRDLSHSA